MPILNLNKKRNTKKAFSIFLLFVFIVVNFFGFNVKTVHATTDAWWNSSWGYRIKITIKSSQVPSTQTSFPVYVNLYDLPAAFFSNVQSDGRDIRVTNSDASNPVELARQVVVIDTGAKTGELWFKADSISVGSSYYIYYGNSGPSGSEPAATDADGSQHVWDDGGSNYYKAVYHLPNGSTLSGLDSTSNGNNASTPISAVATAGQIDGGATTTSSGSKYIRIPTSSSLKSSVAAITFSAWVNITANASWSKVFAWDYRADGSWTPPYDVIELNTSYNGTNKPEAIVNTGATQRTAISSDTITTGAWHHLVGVYDGSYVYLYVDSVLKGTSAVTSGNIDYGTSKDLAIGQDSPYNSIGEFLNGKVDELRISSTARSANWIKTEYNNQNATLTFYSVTGPETAPTVPTVTSPTATAIATTSATLGANVTSDGGASLMEVGICWGLSSSSMPNCNAEGGNFSTGVYTMSITGLPAGTLIYYEGYAINSVGIGYSSYDSFTTISTPTVTAISPTTGANTGSSSITSVTGTNFASGATVSLTKSGQSTINCTGFNFTNSTTLSSGTCPITGATIGTWNVVVTNTDTGNGTLTNGFTVITLPGKPTITGVARGGSQTIAVSFSAPSDGGSAITGYTVYNSVDGSTWTGTTSPINATGLTNGTSYTFTVKATNGVGQGPASDASSSITPATVPGAPTITSAVRGGSQEIVLNWSVPSDGGSTITDYMIDFKLHSDSDWTNFPHTPASTATTTTVTGVGLVNGSEYDFRVKAQNGVDWGDYSTTASAIPATTPGKPTITGVTRNGSQTISITFSASDGGSTITGYTVYNSVNGSTWTGTSSPINATSLTNGTAYTFTVKATNDVGDGPTSTASDSIIPATVPGAPTTMIATPGDTHVDLSWNAPGSTGGSDITDYIVEYKLTSEPTIWSTSLHDPSPTTNQTIINLLNGSQYDFQVRALNDVGPGDFSSPVVQSTPRTTPSAPTITGVARGGSQKVAVSFIPLTPPNDGGSPIIDYTVYNNVDSNTATASGSPITVLGLTNGTSYKFTVKARNIAGQGPASTASDSIIPATAPDAPTGLNAVRGNSSGKVDLTWAAPENKGGLEIINYLVEYEPVSAPDTWQQFGHTPDPATSITVINLINGTQYEFRVSAINDNDIGPGSPSSTANATPATIPGAPTIGTPTRGGSNEIKVYFTAPADTGGSDILDYTATSIPEGHTSTASSSPITVSGLTNGADYTFTVHARNIQGSGPESDASNPAIKPATVPSAPSAIVVTPGNQQATVSFAAPDTGGLPITGYTVTTSAGVDSNAGSMDLSHLVTGLTKGATYTFAVTATNDIGTGEAGHSDPVTLPTEPGAPSNLAAEVLGGSVKLTWSAVAPENNGGADVTDYVVEYQKTTNGEWAAFADGESVSTEATVTGLTNDTSYDFRVRAKNIVGPGEASSPVSATPGEPAQVRIMGFPDLTATTISTDIIITNEGDTWYEYQYTWCITDSADNLCGGNDDIFSAQNAKRIESHQDFSTTLNSTVLTPGNYWFHVGVTYGSHTSTSYQSITVVATYPDAPTSVSAVAGNTQATITFTPPASDGGSAITGYTVTSSPGGITGNGSASPITVTGLTNGTTYTFKVNATNSVGTGVASDSSASVMPVTIPDPPTSISATPGNAQVILSWTAPTNTGGLPITDYIIEYKLSSASDSDWATFLDAVSTATTATVTNLTNNSSYDFRVSAVNSFGRSGVNSASGSPAGTTTPPQSGGGGGGGSYITYYTINASAGANGSISPNGPRSLTYGGSQIYTITPATGYQVADVLVDGTSQGAITTYAFNNITGGHTISATFSSIITTPTIIPTTPTKKPAPPKVNKITPTVPSTETNKVPPVITVPAPNVKIPGNKISAVPTAPPATPTLIVQKSGYWILWLLISIFIVLVLATLIIFFIVIRRSKNKQE
ncbi:MAG: fibronectin type III domain-containing protein [Candidatus Staskawiczbacteria bacterium]|nr:fibronectin type III domain-containing protein [Candidatus Staskawiczbacteria bacterium]